mgnify:CR=1 FL=1
MKTIHTLRIYTERGSYLFVPIESWYANGQINPYADADERFFVKCRVQTTTNRRGVRKIEIYSQLYDEIFTDLDETWIRLWGRYSMLPEGGTELQQAHIDAYEHAQAAVDPSSESGEDSEDEGDAIAAGEGALEDEPEEIADINDFEEGKGNAIDEPPFQQALHGRSWRPAIMDKHPGVIFINMIHKMVAHVVACTNSRIIQDNKQVRQLTVGEVLRWHGLRTFMCIYKLPSVDMYWMKGSSKYISWPDFGKHMSFARFKEIKNSLRFEDYTRPHNLADKAWKVRTITNIMKEAFRKHIPAPGRELSVDEGMVRYTGRRCPIKRLMPNKPVRKGFKFFAIVDYETGFLYDFNWDDGTRTAENCRIFEWGMTGQVVLDLVESLPGRGYRIFTDNFYTSVPLARHLLDMGHYLVGTMRVDRGVPGFVKLASKKPTQRCPKGTVLHSHSRDNSIHIYGWMDNGPVYILDTVFGPADHALTRREGARQNVYMVPKACAVYNEFMGGVDKYDQVRTGYYGTEMSGRCAKWTTRLYEALVTMAMANGYALHRATRDEPMKHWQYVLTIAEALMNNVFTQQRDTRAARAELADEAGVVHTLKQHPPGTAGVGNKRKRLCCVQCPNKVGGRRDHKRRTQYYCPECDVALHPECSDLYHQTRGIANLVEVVQEENEY